MECAALFVISSIRRCRAGAIMAFTEMEKSVETACEALKILIEEDKKRG
jgi:uridine phosphorylase